MKLGFLLRQILFGPFLLGDVRHHRDGAAFGRPPAQDAIPSPIGRMILKALARGIAQAFDPPRDKVFNVALAVVPILREVAQKIGVGPAGVQQLDWHPVHLLEAIVAEDEIEMFVRVGKRARHAVECNAELAPDLYRPAIGCIDVAQQRHECTA